MIGEAGPSKAKNISLSYGMGGGLFFYTDIFKVHLPHLPVQHCNTEEGKCGAAFLDC